MSERFRWMIGVHREWELIDRAIDARFHAAADPFGLGVDDS